MMPNHYRYWGLLLLLLSGGCAWVEQYNPFNTELDATTLIEYAQTNVCEDLSVDECYAAGQQALAVDQDLTRSIALVYFTHACIPSKEPGNAAACEQVAIMYRDGKGTKPEPVQAADFFAKACAIDKKSGCYAAAVAFQTGEGGVAKDQHKANELFLNSCNNAALTDRNKGTACTQSGLLTAADGGDTADNRQSLRDAFSLYKKACDNNSAEGCYHAGKAYYSASGVAGSETSAQQYYVQGCNGNYAPACLAAAALKSKSSPASASVYYKEGCSDGDQRSCFELAERYRTGLGVPKNLRLARVTYLDLCSPQYPLACYHGADLLMQSLKATMAPKPTDTQAVLDNFDAACTQAVGLACYQLAGLNRNGQWTKANPPKAAQLLADHCSETEWLGCYDLAIIYAQGDGLEKNQAKAAELFQQVCDATLDDSITPTLTHGALTIAKQQQWQRNGCEQFAQLLWEYPVNEATALDPNDGNNTKKKQVLEKNNASAVLYFKKACALGALPACYQYAVALDNGIGIEQDIKQAFNYYEQSCVLNQLSTSVIPNTITSQTNTHIYLQGEGQSSNVKTRTDFTANVISDIELSPVIGNLDKTEQRLVKTVASACYDLAINYRDGIATRANAPKANQLFKQSCRLGQPQACYNYGLSLNNDDAQRYFSQACNAGLQMACALSAENSR